MITSKEFKVNSKDKSVALSNLMIGNTPYFKIANSNFMRPFFMSIVSDSNHWMFISSNGGLTAGRKNSEFSLFPYYTDDKITESAEFTGSRTILQIVKNGKKQIWEPFSIRQNGLYNISQNLYKSIYGNAIIFEEINHDLELTFKYKWSSSNLYGFVRSAKLINHADDDVSVSILDGIQNILPAGVGSDLQRASSNLVDAYKRNEIIAETGLGIFALSAIIVDKAEPSEALKANVAWSLGIENPNYLLSSLQLDKFRNVESVKGETDVKAEKGAYFVNFDILLPSNATKEWHIVANVNQNHVDIVELSELIAHNNKLLEALKTDIDLGTERLIKLNAASDGLQLTADKKGNARHFSNTLFNIMRGGIFDDNYNIEVWDFKNYLKNANKAVADSQKELLNKLPEIFDLEQLKSLAESSEDLDFKRLCFEYLPLKFSRRHGDPSRPWNKFSINTRSETDGSKILDYEGNWRDIFQNWEALAHSYPEFIESMIHKFLNATTFDGYNPYRITKDGFDWEIIEPDDPWSYIGYWGDHQIIYLLKFLEFIEDHKPQKLSNWFNKDWFVYANVPYKIKPYKDLLKNPKDTIVFDEKLDHKIRDKRKEMGADGALLFDKNNALVRVNFIEKILATTLAKLSNFIPEAGIWMNTQRPEWNDANNALVGNGVSMVTLYYLRRFLKFFEGVFEHSNLKQVAVSEELATVFNAFFETFKLHENKLDHSINNKDRKQILDALGKAASTFREQIYTKSFSRKKQSITVNDLKLFTRLALLYLEHSIRANKRANNLYHAYNIITINEDNSISISYLDEMLEGQVAVLSSGYLSTQEALDVLNAQKHSALFRPDQYSYMLYPNKELKGFMQRNNIPKELVAQSDVLKRLLKNGNTRIINKDLKGNYHFNGNFKNATDLDAALEELLDSEYKNAINAERKQILDIFETVFNHKTFTGRSGTFYGYEGLGSIYWHMVSKLQLAVMECSVRAVNENENNVTIGKLLEHFYEINAGIGVHKPPQLYGAFPTDPYSHTPFGKGVQQPGMTGQVKEDILSRYGELGVFVNKGKLVFNPCLLRKEEFLLQPAKFNYRNIRTEPQTIALNTNELCFTYCQVPIVYKISENNKITVTFSNSETKTFDGNSLDAATSSAIFRRNSEVNKISVEIKENILK